MRKLGIIGVLSMLLVAFSASVALAQNPHFIGGEEPTITISGNTATVTGGQKLAGLGNEDVTFVLEATGFVTTECENPAGNVAPGQNAEFTVESEPITVTPSATGFVIVPTNLSVSGPAVGDPVSDEAAGAPNPKWECSVVSSTITSATLVISQGGEVILTVTEPEPAA
jgi:hypothetical protein